MTADPSRFNAAIDAWIPIATPQGTARVSMREALVRAPEILGISTGDPLAVLPLIRLLVAAVLHAQPVQAPDELRALWHAGSFDAQIIDGYFQRNIDRFDVFHEHHPFLQAANLAPTNGPPKPASALLLNIAAGNNVPLFSAVSESNDIALAVPDALLNALVVLSWDTAAIKPGARDDPQVQAGKTTGNPTGPLGQLGGVVPMGRNLFETLLLNLPLGPRRADDQPSWMRTLTPAWEKRSPTGIMELLTWPSRRIRLILDHESGLVDQVVLSAGDRLLFPDPDLEPHTRWQAPKGGAALRPRRWQAGGTAWRGLDTLLAIDESTRSELGTSARVIEQVALVADLMGDDYPLNLLCTGVVYGNMSAVIEDVFVDSLPLPVSCMRAENLDARDALRETAQHAEKVRRALNNLADNVREIQGGDRLPWDAGVHPGNDTMLLLSEPTHRLLAGVQREPDRLEEGLAAWQVTVRRIALEVADDLLNAAGPQAFAGRTRTLGSTERHVRLADVDAWFHKALVEAFPSLYQQTNSRSH